MAATLLLSGMAAIACGHPSGSDSGTTVITTGNGGTPADAGSPTDGGATGGTATAGAPASGGGAGAPAGGGGSGAAPAPADPCDGLAPSSVPAPLEVAIDGQSCSPSTSDPAGHVTLGVFGQQSWEMHPYDASGAPAGVAMTGIASNGTDLDRWFHWTSSGYQGLVQGPGIAAPDAMQTWDVLGHPVSRTTVGISTITPDGKGGTVALAPGPSPSSATFLQWYDAGGNLVRGVQLDQKPGAVLVNWSTGHVFALVFGDSGHPTEGRWFDESGNPLTGWFNLNVGKGTGATWHLLIDGTVVLVGPDGGWNGASGDGVEGPVPVPAWLASRPNTRIATIRGGRGYALLPVPGVSASAAESFEIVTTSGASCGNVALPAAPPAAFDAPLSRIDLGQDGTVFQTHAAGPAASGSGWSCSFRWWPALLK